MKYFVTALCLAIACAVSAQEGRPAQGIHQYSDVFGMTIMDSRDHVRVLGVARGSDAARAGIAANDMIVYVGQSAVETVAEMFDKLEHSGAEWVVVTRAATGGTKTLRVKRPDIKGRIVFQSNRFGNSDIYSMNANGSDVTRLTETDSSESNPVWSPDGKRIAFTCTRDGGFLELCTMSANGQHYRLMSETPFAETLPRWSPDGKTIYFLSNQNQKWELFRTPSDHFDPDPIIEISPDVNNMAWTYPAFDVAPDGRHIVFPKLREGTTFDDKVLDMQTGKVEDLAPHLPAKIRPSWTKDGRRIVVNAPEPYIIDLDTGATAPLALQAGEASLIGSVTWSPTGRYLIMAERPAPDEPTQLYVIGVNGSHKTRLTFSTAEDHFADWTGEKK